MVTDGAVGGGGATARTARHVARSAVRQRGGEQREVANADEAFREDVQQEALRLRTFAFD